MFSQWEINSKLFTPFTNGNIRNSKLISNGQHCLFLNQSLKFFLRRSLNFSPFECRFKRRSTRVWFGDTCLTLDWCLSYNCVTIHASLWGNRRVFRSKCLGLGMATWAEETKVWNVVVCGISIDVIKLKTQWSSIPHRKKSAESTFLFNEILIKQFLFEFSSIQSSIDWSRGIFVKGCWFPWKTSYNWKVPYTNIWSF